MSNLIGKSLGRYHILEPLGEGGMAVVYKAYDTRLETDVAVKVIRTENILPSVLERSLKRFEREAKSLARLTHPNIVKVTDYGEFEGKPYLVMPYLPGGTLKDRIKQGQIPWQEAVRLILPIAQALEYAHEHNIIHRDVKPSNILLTEKGQPMLTDFGVAKLFDMESTADLTGTGMGVGTPEYMAPEQWQGQVSAQTDVYALGVVLYEMVTGRRPYTADTPAALLIKQTNDPLPRPKQFVPGLPDAMEKAIIKALAKQSVTRYQNIAVFSDALEGVIPEKTRIDAPLPQLIRAIPQQPLLPTLVAKAVSWPGEKKSMFFKWLIDIIGIVFIAVLVGLLNGSPTKHLPITTSTAIFLPSTTLITIEIPTITKSPTEPPVYTMPSTKTSIEATTEEITDAKGVVMQLVPAGEFTMGSDNNDDDEKPIHQVYLDTYYMDKYEVTNRLYHVCASAGICDPPRDTSSVTRASYYGNSQFANYPVINVDWYQAKAYCIWRGARLPTEAEWEKAARGTDGLTYPWGEGINCGKANYWGKESGCVGDTTEVGRYPNGISPYGIFDMAGNVWEWIADWYSETYYQNSPFENPIGLSSGKYRGLRGGSWGYLQYGTRASDRFWVEPFDWSASIGFRCAISAQ
jgi:serine/threonine protein kinase